MTSKDQLALLIKFATALEAVEKMPHYSVRESVLRAAKLIELCPWIDDFKEAKAGKPAKKAKEPTK